MSPRRYSAWVRLLCAVAFGLGLAGASSSLAASPDSTPARPAIAHIQGAVGHVTATTARAPLALSHHIGRRLPAATGAALLATALLVGALFVSTRRRLHSTSGYSRRTSPVGARAPPVAVGI